MYIALPCELRVSHRLAAGGERVFEAAVGLVVAPHELFVADSGRAARLPLEVRLPDSDDPLPLLCRPRRECPGGGNAVAARKV